MSRVRACMAAFAGFAALAIACNALNGVGDLDEVDSLEASVPDTGTPATCACAPAAPEGWAGPLAIVLATGGAPAACPPATSSLFMGHGDLDAAAGCSACTCGAPEGDLCAQVTLGVFNNGTCTSTCSEQVIGTTCSKARYCGTNQAASFDAEPPPFVAPDAAADAGPDAASAVAPHCAPSGGAVAPATWDKAVAACALDPSEAGACPAGQACGIAGATACVLRAGDVDCPAGPFHVKSVYYASLSDTRTCAPCACDPPSGVRCGGGAVSLWIDPTCTGNPVLTTPAAAACKGFSNPGPNGGAMITTPLVPEGGSCAPHGGDVGGEATAAQPATVCCVGP